MRAFAGLLFVFALVAQTVAQAPPRPGILHAVTIKGNRLYSSEEIVKQAGLKIGQPVSAPVIEKARVKLQQTELFTNVADQYRTSGNPPQYDLTFELVENEQLFPMRFERLGASPEAISSSPSCLRMIPVLVIENSARRSRDPDRSPGRVPTGWL